MSFVPFCGHSPVPGGVAWNLDPLLLGTLGAVATVYFGVCRRDIFTFATAWFATGWLVLVLALISPLCNLSVALFSARVGQHMLLTLVAAPTIAAGMRLKASRLRRGNLRLSIGCATFATVLWFWHSPDAYDASLRNNVDYWLMQVSIVVSAVYLWKATLSSGPARRVLRRLGYWSADVPVGRSAHVRAPALFFRPRVHDSPVGFRPARGSTAPADC